MSAFLLGHEPLTKIAGFAGVTAFALLINGQRHYTDIKSTQLLRNLGLPFFKLNEAAS